MPGPEEYIGVRGPTPASYQAPQVDFSWLGNLMQDYYAGQMAPLELALRRAQIGQYQDYLRKYGVGGGMGPTASADTTGTVASEPARSTEATARDPRSKIPTIIAAAQKYGVDPATAIRVAKSEGLTSFFGDGGKSGGAFQLYTGGGLGNDFQRDTGLNPLDPKNEDATIDYAMMKASQGGWGPWNGAKKIGLARWEGIGRGSAPVQTASASDQLNPTDRAAVDAMYPPTTEGTSTAQPSPNEPFPAAGSAAAAIMRPPFAPTANAAASSPAASGPANMQLANNQPAGPQPAAAPVVQPTRVAQAAPPVPGEPDLNPAIQAYDRRIAEKQRETIELSNYAANPYAAPAAKLRAEQAQDELKRLQDNRNKLYERLGAERKIQLEEQSAERKQEYGVGVAGRTGIETALTKRVGEAIEAGGKSTRGAVQTLDAMEDAVRSGGGDITFGPAGEQTLKLKEFANGLWPGVFKGVAEAETLKKLNAQLAAEAAKGMTARPSQLEFKTFVANNPGLMTTREGTLALINILRQVKQQDLKLGNLASNVQNPRDWPKLESDFFADPRNQIISPFTNKPVSGAERVPGGGGRSAAPARPSGLPAGSQYSPSRNQWRDPNGRIYDAAGRPMGT
jgi:hypothetical protein